MALRGYLERLDPAKPYKAVERAAAPFFGGLAPTRRLLIAAAGWSDTPGLDVAPWTIDGLRRAAEAAELQADIVHLGPGRPSLRWPRNGQPNGRRIAVDFAGTKRPRRVPAEWIGRHLCLVVPCVFWRQPRLGRQTKWQGPLRSAVQAFDATCAEPHRRERAEIAPRVAALSFASMTVVVDASWWAPMSENDEAPPELAASERVLCVGTPAPSVDWADALVCCVDDWLTRATGLTPGVASELLRLSGSALGLSWPRLKPVGPGGFGAQAMGALWRAASGARRHGAAKQLVAPAPGSLAKTWRGYRAP